MNSSIAQGHVIDEERDEALLEFLKFSRDIGSDFLKTQGAGGNTSLKDGGTMWIKASGTWLSDALDKDIMVPVHLEPLKRALMSGDDSAERATEFVVQDWNRSGLRPSIETSFHAVLPQRIVAHYHCVDAMALLVLRDREREIATRMEAVPDLSWEIVPYVRPGMPLALEIAKLHIGEIDVLFLCNHGIVVTGDTVTSVREKIAKVGSSIAMAKREATQTGAPMLFEVANYAPPDHPDVQGIAFDTTSIRTLNGGALVPEQVVFLDKIEVLESGAGQSRVFSGGDEVAPKMIVVIGEGVLLRNDLSIGGRLMARCLFEVARRIPGTAGVIYLDEDQEYELVNWEAEHYRKTLDARKT